MFISPRSVRMEKEEGALDAQVRTWLKTSAPAALWLAPAKLSRAREVMADHLQESTCMVPRGMQTPAYLFVHGKDTAVRAVLELMSTQGALRLRQFPTLQLVKLDVHYRVLWTVAEPSLQDSHTLEAPTDDALWHQVLHDTRLILYACQRCHVSPATFAMHGADMHAQLPTAVMAMPVDPSLSLNTYYTLAYLRAVLGHPLPEQRESDRFPSLTRWLAADASQIPWSVLHGAEDRGEPIYQAFRYRLAIALDLDQLVDDEAAADPTDEEEADLLAEATPTLRVAIELALSQRRRPLHPPAHAGTQDAFRQRIVAESQHIRALFGQLKTLLELAVFPPCFRAVLANARNPDTSKPRHPKDRDRLQLACLLAALGQGVGVPLETAVNEAVWATTGREPGDRDADDFRAALRTHLSHPGMHMMSCTEIQREPLKEGETCACPKHIRDSGKCLALSGLPAYPRMIYPVQHVDRAIDQLRTQARLADRRLEW